jgi:hypothetical protein
MGLLISDEKRSARASMPGATADYHPKPIASYAFKARLTLQRRSATTA